MTQAQILACLLLAEAGGEPCPKSAMRLVGDTLFNRSVQWSRSPFEIAAMPYQYAGFVVALSPTRQAKFRQHPQWDYACRLACQLENGSYNPMTTFTHFYARRLSIKPMWALGKKGTIAGNHLFLTL